MKTEQATFALYESYKSDFNQVYKEADELFELLVLDVHGEETYDQFLNLRLRFKKISFLLEYVNKDWYKKLNGSPTISIEFEENEQNSVLPSGLQVLETRIWEKAPSSEILNSLMTFRFELQQFEEYLLSMSLTEAQWLESVLLALIRVETLSLGGFDHQGIDQRFDEMEMEIAAIQQLIQQDFMKGKDSSIESSFKNLRQLIDQKKESDDIHYVTLVKSGIVPLRSALLEHYRDQLPFVNPQQDLPIDLSRRSLYDDGFIDAKFYGKHGQEKINETILNLGKTLFFDPVLSRDLNMSCASCHNPAYAFTESPAARNGISGLNEMRNVPSLLNVGYQSRYMYDMREQFLEDQLDHVINAQHEFNFSMNEIVTRLKESAEYRDLFEKAFEAETTVTAYSISKAIAEYVRSLNALQSPFDDFMNNTINVLDTNIIKGFDVFMEKGNCASCHFPPMFNGLLPPYFLETESEVLSIPIHGWKDVFLLDDDLGRYNYEIIEDFKHSFKTTTVRNSALTAPYMHNGSIDNLADLMTFYDKGGGAGFGHAFDNQTLSSEALSLSQGEMNNLISFIESLTDTTSLDNSIVTQFPAFENKPEWNDRKNIY